MPVPPFDPAVLAPDPSRRTVVLEVLAAALRAVDPATAVQRALAGDGGTGPVTLLAFGKAAAAMAHGAAAAVPVAGGVVVAPQAGEVPAGVELIVGSHPAPSAGSEQGARRALAVAGAAGAGDTVLVLVSGGASALAEAPADGVPLADVVRVGELLLRSGAPIEEVNAVRKHLSAFKGGRLAEAAAPARLVTLVLSDVVGSPLDAIASGPTVPDPTTYGDALGVLTLRGLVADTPPAVLAHLRAGAAGAIAETPKAAPAELEHRAEVVADGATAARAAAEAARRRGLDARVVTSALTGEAREVGRRLALPGSPGLDVYAGETTVTVTGAGRGGRNQELALAAAIAAAGDPALVVAALGTDGVDGPTSAAGGLVDGGTVARAAERGLDPAGHLDRNDAHPLLAATSDLLVTGPTGTNVGDVTVVWRRPPGA